MARTLVGWGSGFLGMVIFSGSLPATKVAVTSLSPLFLTSARAAIAAALAAALMAALRQKPPARSDWASLVVVSVGVVIGFPLLTALALQHITSARSIVFTGLLPLSTAIFGILRGGAKPKPAFWLFSLLGSSAVVAFALSQDIGKTSAGDFLMLGAVLLCGLGYAEGANLSRRLGGLQVISWALILALPAMVAVGAGTLPRLWSDVGIAAWVGLAYVSVFSMFIGFVLWYRGLALGGVAGVSQLQLLQPFFGLILAAVVLGEPVASGMIVATGLVVVCVAGARRFA